MGGWGVGPGDGGGEGRRKRGGTEMGYRYAGGENGNRAVGWKEVGSQLSGAFCSRGCHPERKGGGGVKRWGERALRRGKSISDQDARVIDEGRRGEKRMGENELSGG